MISIYEINFKDDPKSGLSTLNGRHGMSAMNAMTSGVGDGTDRSFRSGILAVDSRRKRIFS